VVVEDSALLITTCLLSPPSGTTLECNYLTSFHGGICCTYGNHGSVREYSSTSAACVLALWILMVEFGHKWLREAPPWWQVQRGVGNVEAFSDIVCCNVVGILQFHYRW